MRVYTYLPCHRFFLLGFLFLLLCFLVHEGQYQLWSSGGAWMMPAHRLHKENEPYTHGLPLDSGTSDTLGTKLIVLISEVF